MSAEIRKIAVFLEETRSEMGQAVSPPVRKAAAVAAKALSKLKRVERFATVLHGSGAGGYQA